MRYCTMDNWVKDWMTHKAPTSSFWMLGRLPPLFHHSRARAMTHVCLSVFSVLSRHARSCFAASKPSATLPTLSPQIQRKLRKCCCTPTNVGFFSYAHAEAAQIQWLARATNKSAQGPPPCVAGSIHLPPSSARRQCAHFVLPRTIPQNSCM